MTREEAEEYAKEMTYRDAINNLMKARSIPYRKATFIKVNELLKVLEQEPSGDLISRQVIKSEYKRKLKETLIDKDRNIDLTEYTDCSSFNEFIDSIPSIKPQPCEDVISRQIISDYVESHIQEINTGYGDLNKHTNEILKMIVDYIESMPSVKPQEKTGYWIPLYDYTDERDDHRCSVCGFESMGATRYCPDCGIRMFEPQESEASNG